MRVSAIQNVNSYQKRSFQTKCEPKNSGISFERSYVRTAAGAGIFGGLGALGAIGGLIIMTGGIALPIVAAYSATCAAAGAVIGNEIDRGIAKDEKEEKNKKDK